MSRKTCEAARAAGWEVDGELRCPLSRGGGGCNIDIDMQDAARRRPTCFCTFVQHNERQWSARDGLLICLFAPAALALRPSSPYGCRRVS